MNASSRITPLFRAITCVAGRPFDNIFGRNLLNRDDARLGEPSPRDQRSPGWILGIRAGAFEPLEDEQTGAAGAAREDHGFLLGRLRWNGARLRRGRQIHDTVVEEGAADQL